MKRPLCLICVAFVVSVFISLQMTPLSESMRIEDGSWCTYTGEVYHKEYRYNSLILYLRNISQVDSTKVQENNFSLTEETRSLGLLCYVEKGREPRLGSDIVIRGEISSFHVPRNPGGFDQKMYYRIQNIGFSLKDAQIVAESEAYSRYHEGLYQLRRHMEQVFDRTMSEKNASIMKAMLLGNKSELDQESKLLYQRSGILHVLAISGLHISLIGMGVYKLLRRFRVPGVVAAVLAVIIMIMYGDMVGSSASAFRAIFMFGLRMGAEVLHRTYDLLTALALAAVGILLEQPLYLYQAGFLLSFGAIVGLGCMSEVLKTDTGQMPVNKRLQKRREWMRNLCVNRISDSLCSSFSIFLIHFPMMLSVYYEFPVYSFLLNMVIIPVMNGVMSLGLCCMLVGSLGLGMCTEGIAAMAAGLCELLLVLSEQLCEWSVALPGADWIVGEPERWRIIVFYLVVFLLFGVHKYVKYRERGKLVLPLFIKLVWILLAVNLLTQKCYGGLTITMLDVGQGDCIWLETEGGSHYLIDGGSTTENKLYQYMLAPFLKQTGTDVIDAVFLTHLDRDHTSGVLELLEDDSGIKVRCIVLAKAVIRDEAYDELAKLCRKRGILLRYAEAGDVLTDGKLCIEVLHPAADYATESHNAYSLVMKLEYGDFHALFTGDVEVDGEAFVQEALPFDWKCHLYKTAHHGSRNSNSMELLEQISPLLAVISCAEDNSYGHPHAETLERLDLVGTKVYQTPQSGAITIEVDEEGMQVREFVRE